MRVEANGTVIHFEGTEEEWSVFLPIFKERMRASAEQFAEELLEKRWQGTSPIVAPKGLLTRAKDNP